MFHDQHPQTIQRRTDFLFRQNFTPVTVVRQCIRRQCFILLPNVWVVKKIHFAILHKIVAINNVQQCIRLNKQKEKKKVFALLHYFWSAMLHIRVICFQHMAAWKRRSDTCKVCGNIFEDRNVQLYLNIHCRFGGDFVKSSGYMMTFILVYAESFKSIGMLASRVSFCCCQSKVCSDAFVNLFSPSFLQHGCVLKS